MKRMKMKKTIMTLLVLLCAIGSQAQTYTIKSGGQGKSGNYLVRVTVTTSTKEKNLDAEDLVKRYAVHGVLFRGLMAADGYGEQKPLVGDPAVEQTKADFFNPFFEKKEYNTYVSIVDQSLTSTKTGKKYYEASALLLVDKESLRHYMEENGIIKGFSNLW